MLRAIWSFVRAGHRSHCIPNQLRRVSDDFRLQRKPTPAESYEPPTISEKRASDGLQGQAGGVGLHSLPACALQDHAPEEAVMERFYPGEMVMLREAAVDTRGRVVDVSADGRTVDVRWSLRPGHDNEITTEDPLMLRRVHESEEGMATA
jgi:hypothetical protein